MSEINLLGNTQRENALPGMEFSHKCQLRNLPEMYDATQNVEDAEDEYSDPDFEEDELDFPTTAPQIMTDLILKEALSSERELDISWAKMLQNNPLLTAEIREKAIKRIIQFNYTFQLSSDAFHNAVMYFNIVLSHTHIENNEMELLASVCYQLASKVDTRFFLSPPKFNAVLGTDFTQNDFKAMEMKVVITLGFKLSYPTSKLFMRGLIQSIDAQVEVIELTNVLVELAMMIPAFISIPPSIQAIAAVAISCAAVGSFDVAKEVTAQCAKTDNLLLCIDTMINCGRTFVKKKEATESSTQSFLAKLSFAFERDALF